MNLPKENIKKCIEQTVFNLAKKGVAVNINSIPLNDKITLQLYCDGNIKHVYNTLQRDVEYLKQIKHIKFDDLVNITALTIPGKEHFIQPYIKSRNKLKPVVYLHPILKPILKHTQGLILFHEQFIEIFKQFGNFSNGEAMQLNFQFCASGMEIHDAIEIKFISNAQKKHGLSDRKMKKLLQMIFESYISVPRLYHITEFTLLSYQTAYLKTYYPEAYLKEFKKSKFNW